MFPIPPAIVIEMTERPVPLSADPDVAGLQIKAEAYVATLRNWRDVERFEKERKIQRDEMGLPPVPVTNRGFKVLTSKQYAVSKDGYLTLG